MVDVGAAAGDITRRLRLLGNDDTRVVAYEPFPPNFQFFESQTRDLDSVILVRKAISDSVGTASFYVHSTVSGLEPGWETRVGYSSVGQLATGLRHQIALKFKRGVMIEVETTTLDAEFNEPISFLKVDVQGGEHLVLAGAERLLSKGQIRMAYIEWSGDPDVVASLHRHSYRTYDSHYVGWSSTGSAVFERQGFEVVGRLDLSVGQRAFIMINLKDQVGERLRRLNTPRGQWIQTDLVAIPHDRVAQFESQLA